MSTNIFHEKLVLQISGLKTSNTSTHPSGETRTSIFHFLGCSLLIIWLLIRFPCVNLLLLKSHLQHI